MSCCSWRASALSRPADENGANGGDKAGGSRNSGWDRGAKGGVAVGHCKLALYFRRIQFGLD